MKDKTKGILLGALLGIVLSGTVAVAASTSTLYDVITSGVRIVVDGKELHPTDVNGNTVEPMIYNGTTYLPVRAVAGALGKAVYWDGENFTVYLGDTNGKLEYPSVYLKDMTNIAQHQISDTKYCTDNYDNQYGYALSENSWNDCMYEVLTNMKYSRFKGTLYVPKGMTRTSCGRLKIEVDGKVKYTSEEITNISRPVDIDISVKGGNDIKIIFENVGDYSLCLADAGFYQ